MGVNIVVENFEKRTNCFCMPPFDGVRLASGRRKGSKRESTSNCGLIKRLI